MSFELHPDAARNFDTKASDLLISLTTNPQEETFDPRNRIQPDAHVSRTYTEKDLIGAPKFTGMEDHLGREVAKTFEHNGELVNLHGESYQELRKLARAIQRLRGFRDAVSTDFVVDVVFEWMEERYKHTTTLPMTEYLIDRCREAVEEFEVWIPIANLSVESEVKFGKMVFKPIKKETFDRWQEETRARSPAQENRIDAFFEKERIEYQGLAAATIELTAERRRAFELAHEEAEKTLAVLRLYSPGALVPEFPSYQKVRGKETIEAITYLRVRDGDLLSVDYRILDRAVQHWHIDAEKLSEYRRHGFEKASNLLSKDRRTPFQEDLIEALMLFSKSTLEKDFADKYVYLFAAVESILLRNSNEPLQQNIGERMAFLIGNTASERKSVIGRLKEAYALRSSFVHHGREIEQLETVRDFMSSVWALFVNLVHNAENLETKEQLIESIDDMKLS